MAKDLAPFYFHGEHSNGAERYRFLFTDQIGTIWNSQARKLREDSLGTFNIRLHGARHDERYGFRETLKMALRLYRYWSSSVVKEPDHHRIRQAHSMSPQKFFQNFPNYFFWRATENRVC